MISTPTAFKPYNSIKGASNINFRENFESKVREIKEVKLVVDPPVAKNLVKDKLDALDMLTELQESNILDAVNNALRFNQNEKGQTIIYSLVNLLNRISEAASEEVKGIRAR